MEVILELAPDLILFAGFSDPDVLAQLNAIAPVCNTATFAEDWPTQFIRVGDSMNMGAEADAFVADYDARVAALGASLGEAGDEMFIVGRWTAEGPQIIAPSTFSSRILIDVDMQPPAEIPELQQGHPHSAPLSLETVGVIDVDWAFLGTLQGQGDSVKALELELWPEHGWDCFDYVKAGEVVDQDASDESQWADARLRYMATPEGLERIVESRVEISHKIETEHATALDKKLSYPQYQVTQKKEYIDLALQGEL